MKLSRMICWIMFIATFTIIFGCTGRSYTPNYIATDSLNPQNAILIMGAEIGQGNIQSYLFGLYVDKELVGMQGPIQGKSSKFWTAHHHFKYLDVDEKGHVFLLWEIPQKILNKGGTAALIYPTCISNKTESFFYWDAQTDLPVFDRHMGLYPIMGKRNLLYDSSVPAQFNDKSPVIDFKGCIFRIDQPGIYFLGDIKVGGVLNKMKMEDSNWEKLEADMQFEIKDNSGMLKTFLEKNDLTKLKIIDVSRDWKVYPMARYYDMTRKTE